MLVLEQGGGLYHIVYLVKKSSKLSKKIIQTMWPITEQNTNKNFRKFESLQLNILELFEVSYFKQDFFQFLNSLDNGNLN